MISAQYSVTCDRELFQQQKNDRPDHRAEQRAHAASTTMTMRSPERVQFITAGLTKSVLLRSARRPGRRWCRHDEADQPVAVGGKPMACMRCSLERTPCTTMPKRELTMRQIR